MSNSRSGLSSDEKEKVRDRNYFYLAVLQVKCKTQELTMQWLIEIEICRIKNVVFRNLITSFVFKYAILDGVKWFRIS